MSRTIILSCLLVSAILLPSIGDAVHLGQSPDEVRAELGTPNGMRTRADKQTWVYSGDITIEFENNQLVRAKGLLLESTGIQKSSPVKVTPEPAVKPQEQPENAPVEQVVPDPEPVESPKPLMQDMADTIEEYEHLEEQALGEFGGLDEVPSSATFLERAIAMALPVFLTFVFLVIAFKLTGAEAMKLALLVIAIVDFLVVRGVQWFFLEFLEFPMTFYADTALSIIVMLALITKMTHAKQLHTAIRVVVASKVAAMAAFWLLAIFVLHNL